MKTRIRLTTSILFAALFGSTISVNGQETPPPYDIVVYGGTSGGIIAAIQAKAMDKTVLLIEPSKHLGGLTAGGLGATDIGNKAAIGGLSRSFYRRIAEYYANDEAWTWEKRENYRSNRQGNDEAMWMFEPHVAEFVYRQMLEQSDVPVLLQERLDLDNGVMKTNGRIDRIRMESGKSIAATMFIDATYEGDLLAKTGVSYFVGREGNDRYGETLNGVQTRNATHHQFIKSVDPFVRPGDPSSGLLPLIQEEGPGEEGAEDHRVQAYNLRLCTTDIPENRRAWPKPDDYDESRWELLFRNFEAGDLRFPWNPVFMPNRKTDTNNNFAISTDFLGANYDYPEGDYATRERIYREHVSYISGLMWTLANHPRVPKEVREHFQNLGMAKDEFRDNDNWPHQLYIREARRMVSDYVMTQHDCQGRITAADPVGLAAYTMDSHNTQRYARDGRVWNEGDVQVGGFSPYPISYRSIVPKKNECKNLLVPVSLSASHIAYGSIRMEPVFMVLGQSAATAAALAIDAGIAVQDVDYQSLRDRLVMDDQILEWTGPKRTPGIDPARLEGIVIDDKDAIFVGEWGQSSSVNGYVGTAYRHDNNAMKGECRAEFSVPIAHSGMYEVRVYYTANPNRATNARVAIVSSTAESTFNINQREDNDKGFRSLGKFTFDEADRVKIIVKNDETDGYVIVDAVQLIKK
ncbi:MAG: FAD-dependent oxidoreductase [Planctomycetota bacterium]|nr:FAD-dependent oxidoreductase [Planctomycetota bacterium]MDA1213156.1 FAD-dependent oxidoreductase [Planctomycetota bacterium]